MTRLYISGPMTGIEDHNFPAFNAAAEKLAAAGYEVENPAERGVLFGWTWEDYLTEDLRMVLNSDGLAMLPGWLASKGANLEVYVARQLKKPIFPVEHWLSEARKVAA